MDRKALLLTFAQALDGLPAQAVIDTAHRFVAGRVEGQSRTFAPSVAEFAQEARRLSELRSIPGDNRRLFAYLVPNSKLLERGITKDYARQLVDQGVHPRGSIWCPGSLDGRSDIGDLFAPDPNWRPAKSLANKLEHKPYQPDDAKARIRMGFKMNVLSAGVAMSAVDQIAESNALGMDDLMALAQSWGVTIPDELFERSAETQHIEQEDAA